MGSIPAQWAAVIPVSARQEGNYSSVQSVGMPPHSLLHAQCLFRAGLWGSPTAGHSGCCVRVRSPSLPRDILPPLVYLRGMPLGTNPVVVTSDITPNTTPVYTATVWPHESEVR